MDCPVATSLETFKNTHNQLATAEFANDKNSLVGLAHAAAAHQYQRTLMIHDAAQDKCTECARKLVAA